MNPSSFLFLNLIVLGLIFGCRTRIHLYPVQGVPPVPAPLPTLTAEFRGPGSRRGTLVITSPGGEACAGSWVRIPPGGAGPGGEADLSAEWDRVYGPGYYVANVLGALYRGQGSAMGGQGAVFHLEFYRSSIENVPTLGVAKDNRGQVYKVAL